MKSNSAIADRIIDSISHYSKDEFEKSLLHLCPALDATAKKRYPRKGNADRVKSFLRDENDFIWGFSIQKIIRITPKENDFAHAFYKLTRNPICHEGSLDHRLRYEGDDRIMIGPPNWNLSPNFIVAIQMLVITAPESKSISTQSGIVLNANGSSFDIDTLWGNPEKIFKLAPGLKR